MYAKPQTTARKAKKNNQSFLVESRLYQYLQAFFTTSSLTVRRDGVETQTYHEKKKYNKTGLTKVTVYKTFRIKNILFQISLVLQSFFILIKKIFIVVCNFD